MPGRAQTRPALSDALCRILVFDLPPLLRDLVRRALDGNADMTSLVAEAGQLEPAVAASRPDAVIVPLDDEGLPAESRRFLEDRARVRVLGVGVRDGRAVLHELRPERSELGEVAPADLPRLIRQAVGRKAAI